MKSKARYAPGTWEIIAPPEIRDVDPRAADFSGWRTVRALPR